jgi:hypothetical protein
MGNVLLQPFGCRFTLAKDKKPVIMPQIKITNVSTQTIGKSEITAADSSQASTQLNYWNSFQQIKQKCYNCRSRAISYCDGLAADIPSRNNLKGMP